MKVEASSDGIIGRKIFFFLSILFIFSFPYIFPNLKDMRPGLSLFLGMLISLSVGNPFPEKTKIYAPKLLSYSVVGLGFGMNFMGLLKAGFYGTGYTVVSIVLTFLLGSLLSALLKNDNEASLLVTTGTAICGGSAIAAVAPVIRAKNQDITISLGTVFVLNALALILFPKIGQHLHLTQTQFGLWCALAIHDTSSVVGASIQFGQEALDVGTTIKMARALWIIPLTLVMAFYYSRKNGNGGQNTDELKKVKRPWFILGLFIAAAIVTWVPGLAVPGTYLRDLAKEGLVLTLFLIGINLNFAALKGIGWKSFVHGSLLWFCMASLSLVSILLGWVEV